MCLHLLTLIGFSELLDNLFNIFLLFEFIPFFEILKRMGLNFSIQIVDDCLRSDEKLRRDNIVDRRNKTPLYLFRCFALRIDKKFIDYLCWTLLFFRFFLFLWILLIQAYFFLCFFLLNFLFLCLSFHFGYNFLWFLFFLIFLKWFPVTKHLWSYLLIFIFEKGSERWKLFRIYWYFILLHELLNLFFKTVFYFCYFLFRNISLLCWDWFFTFFLLFFKCLSLSGLYRNIYSLSSITST